MFNKPTTIILGAGASFECNLPLGSALRDSVASAINFRFRGGYEMISGDQNLYEHLKHEYKKDLNSLAEAGRRLSAAAPSFPSIDEALHYFGDQRETVEIGKLAIALTILSAERDSLLAVDPGTGRVAIDRLRGTWYDDFFSMALSGLRKEEITRIFENVSFINFNYDRSLECYLFHSLTNVAQTTPTVAADIIGRTNVIRPYGSLGALDLQHRPYVGIEQNLFEMAGRIRTFTEAQQEDVQTRIIETLDQCSLVIVLGFGFHNQNMKLLAPPGKSKRKGAVTFVTAKDVHNENLGLIDRALSQYFNVGGVKMFDMTAHDLLSKLRPSIMAAAN